MLVAIATALDKPVSQPIPEWQKKHLTEVGHKSYKTDDERVHLRIDARIVPFLGKQKVYDREPALQDRPCFYQLQNGKNVIRVTACFVDKALDDLLFTLCQDRLADKLASPTMLNQTVV